MTEQEKAEAIFGPSKTCCGCGVKITTSVSYTQHCHDECFIQGASAEILEYYLRTYWFSRPEHRVLAERVLGEKSMGKITEIDPSPRKYTGMEPSMSKGDLLPSMSQPVELGGIPIPSEVVRAIFASGSIELHASPWESHIFSSGMELPMTALLSSGDVEDLMISASGLPPSGSMEVIFIRHASGAWTRGVDPNCPCSTCTRERTERNSNSGSLWMASGAISSGWIASGFIPCS